MALLNDAMDNNSGGVNNSKESIFVNEDKIACEEGQVDSGSLPDPYMSICLSISQGICAHALVVISVLLIFMTLPFSLCLSVKVVQVIKLRTEKEQPLRNVRSLENFCSGI